MTKIKINFEKENILIKTPKSFQTTALLDNLYKSLNINNELYKLKLLSEDAVLNEKEILIPRKNQQFYLIKTEQIKNDEVAITNMNINSLIQLCTGGDTMLKPGALRRSRPQDDNMSFISYLQSHGFHVINVNNDDDDSEGDEREDASEVDPQELQPGGQPGAIARQAANLTRYISRENITRMIEMGMDEPRSIVCLFYSRNMLDDAIGIYFNNAEDLLDDFDEIMTRETILETNAAIEEAIANRNNNQVNNNVVQQNESVNVVPNSQLPNQVLNRSNVISFSFQVRPMQHEDDDNNNPNNIQNIADRVNDLFGQSK
jgi:hypothetical protein